MKNEKNIKSSMIIPWTVTLILFGLLLVAGYRYKTVLNPFEKIIYKIDIISTMKANLLKVVEAEKSSVLADTDEASIAFADQARNAAKNVEENRMKIQTVINKDNISKELQLISEFNSFWTQYRKLDEIVLDLAVQNTNLKADRLSLTNGSKTIENFERSLTNLIKENSNGSQCSQVMKLSYESLISGLKIYSFHNLHIKEARDEEMDRIENLIRSYNESVRNNLNKLNNIAGLNLNENLKTAVREYDLFMNVTGEVLKLSRKNTNIKSMELSLGKKRIVSAQCLDNLIALQDIVKSRSFISIK